MSIKKSAKSLLKSLGYTTYRSDSLPNGLSWALDVNRLAENRDFKTVFDIGANIGLTTREFSTQFPKAEIFSFEPEHENFLRLQNTVASIPRAQCFEMALGSEDTTCNLYVQAHSEWHSLAPENNKPDSKNPMVQTIAVQTLDTFCREKNIKSIDFLKTDTEGFDLNVLQGGIEKLRQGQISFVFSEVGFNEKDTQHTYFPILLEFLVANGLEFYDLYDHEHARPSSSTNGSYCNALFVNSRI